ncbi:Wzz/FepE/Etk N-terminal domain-containing protein [Catellatospora sp. NPDC049133]|jgi:capsular polysaccharide biosynthesis protein/Mrp family chromosome partitioning ATPase|uniref:Wzz/FepE/Etk N-terminal domain-containing protein n=1 Tax=Catellatospora sp. NPDC049133 TaxID=3155499 RepID=UPI0033F70767
MATNAASVPTASVGDYVGWLARRWWLVVIAVAVGAVGGLGVAATQPKVYVSETKVLVMQVGQDTTTKVNLDTESQVVRSTTVGGAAKNLLNTDTPVEELVSRVTVTVPANTSVLSITFDAPTVAEAQRGSQAFAQAYLDQRAAEAQKNVDVQGAAMRDEIAGLTKQLDEVAAQLVGLAANSADRQKAVQKQQILTSQINTLNARLIPLLATTVKPGNILSAATKPTSPAKPDLMLYLVSGVAIGLLLGLAGALVLDRMDSRIYHSRQIPYRNDVPVLMEVQRGRDKAVADAASALGREFSLLRNVLRVAAGAARGGRPSATDALLICGAAPGPAVEFVVANLAAAFARSGERVVIVCTDSTSHLPAMLGVSPSRGLGDVIAGEVTLDSALYAVPAIRGVSLLGAGRLDPRVELPVAAVSDLLAQLQQQADRVLLATAPPSRAVDAQALSEIAASVLLVVETRVARAEDVEESVEQVARVQGPLAGLLVVRSPRVGRKIKVKAVPSAAVVDQPAVPASADLPRAGREFDQTMVIPRVGEDGDRIEFWAGGTTDSKVNGKRTSSSDQTTSADLR